MEIFIVNEQRIEVPAAVIAEGREAVAQFVAEQAGGPSAVPPPADPPAAEEHE